MGWFEEERASAFHLALGIQECPAPEQRGLLIDLLGDLLILEHGCRISRARYVELPGHRGLIMLPRGLTERQLDEAAFHEATHYLLRHGAGMYFRRHGDMDDPRDQALAAAWEEREEREVQNFLLAYVLPSRLMYLERCDHELAEQSGCSVELVQLRRQRLVAGKVLELRQPPQWSAYPHYRVTCWRSPVRPAVRIRALCEGGPLFEIPTHLEDMDDLQWRINVELIAFTREEFVAKYARYEVPPEEDGMIPLGQMAQWTARVGRRKGI